MKGANNEKRRRLIGAQPLGDQSPLLVALYDSRIENGRTHGEGFVQNGVEINQVANEPSPRKTPCQQVAFARLDVPDSFLQESQSAIRFFTG